MPGEKSALSKPGMQLNTALNQGTTLYALLPVGCLRTYLSPEGDIIIMNTSQREIITLGKYVFVILLSYNCATNITLIIRNNYLMPIPNNL